MDERKLITKQDYEEIAEIYNSDFGNENDNYEVVNKAITLLKQSNLAESKVVDLGSGPGNLAEYLINHGLKNITLVELTLKFSQMLRNKFNDADIRQQDITDFVKSCNNDSISGFFAGYSIIHIPDEEVDLLFSEMYRSLVPGGVFFMSCHKGTFKGIEDEPYQIQNDHRLKVEKKLQIYSNYFTEDELETRLKKAGFKNIRLYTFKHQMSAGDIDVPKILLYAQK